MSCSARWSFVVGAAAVAVAAGFSVVGATFSSRSDEKAIEKQPILDNRAPSLRTPSLPAHSLGTTGAPRPAPRSPGPLVTAWGAPSPQTGNQTLRQRVMETRLRPLLVRPSLRAGVFGFDVRTGSFFDVDGDRPFSAASLIKIPVAIALLAEVDRARILLAEPLTMTANDLAGGSGGLQYMPVGTRFTVGRLAELMIRKSDNTATNILIGRLGGIDRVNAIFDEWGLSHTRLRAALPDMAGTNTTSPRDLVILLERALRGGLLEVSSCERLLSWMRRSHVRSLLPAGVGRAARVANKTGDIPGALGDAGYVEAPGGGRYLLAVQVERPRNSADAKALIRAVSRTVYESLTGLPGGAPEARTFARRVRLANRRVEPRRPKAS